MSYYQRLLTRISLAALIASLCLSDVEARLNRENAGHDEDGSRYNREGNIPDIRKFALQP